MTDDPVPSQLLGLNDVTSKPPESRLTDGYQARRLISRVIWEDTTRSKQRAVVDGLIDGNPPYNDTARKANGLGWTCNLNFMEGDALMDSSAVPYYAIFNGVRDYCDIKLASKDPNVEDWNRKVSRRFSNLLKRWEGFDWEMQACSYHMRKHGIGPYLFDKNDDFRFRSVPTGMCLAPKGTLSCINAHTKWLAVRMSYSAVELYASISNPDAAREYGWNVEAVQNAIKQAGHGVNTNGISWRQNPWELYQQMLKNNDIVASYTDFDDIAVVHMYVQEFPKDGAKQGKISHFIFTESPVFNSQFGETAKDDKDFLLARPNEYDDFTQCIGAFFQNMGNGTWHGVRGLADKAFKHLEISNRLKCRMVDGAFIESSLVLQSDSEKSKDKLALTQVGPVTILPAGLKVQQSKLSGFLDGPITVDRLIGNNLQNNIGMFRNNGREDGRGEVPTATQINAQMTKESSLSQGQMTQYYLQLDTLDTEIYRRASNPKTNDKEAQRFQRECVEDGVPFEAISNVEWVRANRESGYGSPQMRMMNIQQMAPWVPRLPVQGQQNFQDDVIGAIMGADKVDRYNPKTYIPTEDDSIAANENATMIVGQTPIISSGQNDTVHLHIHLGAAAEYFTPIQQAIEAGQNDPAQLVPAFQYAKILAKHCEEHLARLSQDPMSAGPAKLFRESLQNIVSFSGKLRGAIIDAQRKARQAADEQTQATALGALDEAKRQSILSDAENKRMETQAKIQRDSAKAASSITNNAAKTVGELKATQVRTATDSVVKLKTANQQTTPTE